jgi:hypothetical protein
VSYDIARLSQAMSSEHAVVDHITRMHKVKRYIKSNLDVPERQDRISVFLPRLLGTIAVGVVCDSAEPKNDQFFRGRWHNSYAVGFIDVMEGNEIPFAGMVFRSGLGRRVAASSFDGETVCTCEALDVALNVSLLVEEMEFGLQPSIADLMLLKRHGVRATFDCEGMVKICVWTDALDTVQASESLTMPKDIGKRRKSDIMGIRELRQEGWLEKLRHLAGKVNPCDAGTKRMSFETLTMRSLRRLSGTGHCVPWLMTGCK